MPLPSRAGGGGRRDIFFGKIYDRECDHEL